MTEFDAFSTAIVNTYGMFMEHTHLRCIQLNCDIVVQDIAALVFWIQSQVDNALECQILQDPLPISIASSHVT